MYHFIRRCFVLVLVLAFGFSFLLCCFVHTGGSYWPDYIGTQSNYSTFGYSLAGSYGSGLGMRYDDVTKQGGLMPFGLAIFEEINKQAQVGAFTPILYTAYPNQIGQHQSSGELQTPLVGWTGLQVPRTSAMPTELLRQTYTNKSYDVVGTPFLSSSAGAFAFDTSLAVSQYPTSNIYLNERGITPFMALHPEFTFTPRGNDLISTVHGLSHYVNPNQPWIRFPSPLPPPGL